MHKNSALCVCFERVYIFRMRNKMSEISSSENKMGSMPVFKLIINMSLPLMFSMLVQALYNIVDSIFVAQLGEDALTAVSLAFPIQNLMISFAVGTGIGVNALLSLRLGQRNQEDVNKAAMNGVFLSIMTYIAFLIMGMTCVPVYLNSQTSSTVIIAYGEEYLHIVIYLGFGFFSGIMFDRLLQATGRTFLSMISQIVGAVFNIVFDPLLIFGIGIFPKMGIRGAALATVLGQIFALFVSIGLNLKLNHDITFKFKNIIPSGKIIAQIYKVGIPAIALSSITSVVTYFLNLILGRFSMTAIAVYGVYFKLNSFIFMPVFGLSNGIVPIIAYNYGARHHRRITNTIRGALIIASVIMLFGVFLFEAFPAFFMHLFNASDEMTEMGVHCLRRIAPSFIGAAIAITLSSVFQAFGDAIYSMIVSFSRQLLIFLPAAYLLSLTGNINNVWWCFIIAEAMSVGMSVFFMRRVYIKKIKGIPFE